MEVKSALAKFRISLAIIKKLYVHYVYILRIETWNCLLSCPVNSFRHDMLVRCE